MQRLSSGASAPAKRKTRQVREADYSQVFSHGEKEMKKNAFLGLCPVDRQPLADNPAVRDKGLSRYAVDRQSLAGARSKSLLELTSQGFPARGRGCDWEKPSVPFSPIRQVYGRPGASACVGFRDFGGQTHLLMVPFLYCDLCVFS